MKKAAVVLDKWKLPVFEKHLKNGGFDYEIFDGITKDTLSLRVHTKYISKLAPVIEAANLESTKRKKELKKKAKNA